jgi:endonuclease/exonuclease/phosphatase family metal-dependent hydrolase
VGVGAAALAGPPPAPAETVLIQDVTFVSWNVHVGNGDVRGFIRDLRAGLLTGGRPPDHIVVLLQEAVRVPGVPDLGPGVRGARRIAAAHQDKEDIESLGRELGLWLAYVPSMRNGHRPDDPAADRGNAILSTLPLSAPVAIELPFTRQRRVALLTDVALSPTEVLAVGVVHLDALTTSRRLWIFGTRGWRARQVEALAALLPVGSLVVGADLNTWLGAGEPATRHLRRLFGVQENAPGSPGKRRRTLDYLFFRAVPPATGRSVEVPNTYGSDHHPLIGWFNK